ncbi:hypothetical protein ABBQ32_010275 [Trebouxia sp. C0010 RCD-2024]
MWQSRNISSDDAFIEQSQHLVCRAPDTAKIKAKMMYASTKDFFKGHLDGVSIELQANEHDEITEDAIGDAVKSVITRQ